MPVPVRIAMMIFGVLFFMTACSDTNDAETGRIDSTTPVPADASDNDGPNSFTPVPVVGALDDLQEEIDAGFAVLEEISLEDEMALFAIAPQIIDFIALQERVQRQKYRVGYTASGPYFDRFSSQLFLTIVHDARHHRVTGVSGTSLAFQYFILEDRTEHSCVKLSEWLCEPSQIENNLTDMGAETLLYSFALVADDPKVYELRTYDTEIVGVPVRCLQAERKIPASDEQHDGDVEVCVTGEGVPLRARTPDLTLEGIWYEPTSTAEDFVLPAPSVSRS